MLSSKVLAKKKEKPLPATSRRPTEARAKVETTAPAGTAPAGATDEAKGGAEDVVLLGDRTADGKGVDVLRLRRGQMEIGAVRPVEEGKPLSGEVVKLHPREGSPRICDVEVQLSDKELRSLSPGTGRGGPPQVASASYRKNWDAIWKRRRREKSLTN